MAAIPQSEQQEDLNTDQEEFPSVEKKQDRNKALDNTTSKTHETNTSTASSPAKQDGGTMAWIQCAGAFAMMVNSWGIVNSFGVYQDYYETTLLPDYSPSSISWIGSIQGFILVAGGVVGGPLIDRGYLRPLIATGSLFAVFGMMMTSLCHKYWQLILAQGVVVGIGHSCLFIPSTTILPHWFRRRRALAMGIALSGSGIGGICYSIMFRQLEQQIGFGWATRSIAFVMLVTQLVPIFGMRYRVKPKGTGNFLPDISIWKDLQYIFWGISRFFSFGGLYIPYFYVQLYARNILHDNSSVDIYLVALLNAGSIFGRIIPNWFADKIGSLNTIIPCSLVAAIIAFAWIGVNSMGGLIELIAFAWIGVNSMGGLIVFCLFYGFFSGTFVSLSPTVITSMYPDLSKLGSRLGMTFIPIAIGILVGNPIAGAIAAHGFIGLQLFCGACIVVAVLLMIMTRIAKDGFVLMIKS